MNGTIVLCGFMGCGKTTVGRIAAELLDFDFVDMDEFISASEGKSIKQIFDDEGEAYFRELELKAACALAKMNKTVIAVGGGAVMNQKIVEEFHGNNIDLIFIDTPLYVIMQRIQSDTTRPLLLNKSEQDFKRLYDNRRPYYNNAADFMVCDKGYSAAELAQIIAGRIKHD